MAVLLGAIGANKSFGKLDIENLIGKKFSVEIGNHNKTQIWNENDLKEAIGKSFSNLFFDSYFYSAYADDKKAYLEAYKKGTLIPLFKNINKVLNEHFELVDNYFPINTKLLKIKYDYNDIKKMQNDIFLKNKFIPVKMKKDYIEYKKDYSGVDLSKEYGKYLNKSKK